MTDQKRKLEPPLKLEMTFGEALARFIQTAPGEVADSVERSKAKKPPGAKPPTTRTAEPSGRSKKRSTNDG